MPLIQKDSIIGHKDILMFLERVMERNTLAHAYFFVGPEGIGKTFLIEWLVQKLMGPQGLRHPDVFVVERLIEEKTGKQKSFVSVEQMREVRMHMSTSSFLGGWKIVFIKEAEYMNKEAANALLKILEEPPQKRLFLLRASSPESLPLTILSRCQLLRCKPVSEEMITLRLIEDGFSKEEAKKIAVISAGRPGIAFSFAEDIQVREQYEEQRRLFSDLLVSSPAKRLTLLSGLLPKEEQNRQQLAQELLERWESTVRDLLLSSLHLKTNNIGEESSSVEKSSLHWCSVLERIRKVHVVLKQNAHPLIGLEEVLLHL